MNAHAELDWPGVLRLAGRFCATRSGRDLVGAAEPSPDPAEVASRAALTADLMARASLRPAVVLGGLDEARAPLARLGVEGRALPPEDLLDVFAFVERSEEARHSVPVEGLDLPRLTALLAPLADFSHLLTEREVVFEPDGRVRDTASARLAGIRAAIVRLRRDVVRRLEEIVRSHADAFADGYVTEKGGRYCVPLRTDRREAVAGIVHEKSGSGQTLFVEPLAAVDANNALAEALEEEREEVHRILLALTARLAARRAELTSAVRTLSELDAYQARAEFSRRVDGVFPQAGDHLALFSARHPLLDRRLGALREDVFGERAEERGSDAVPIDLELPAGKRLLLLSGPNAGGKTVAMKTAGLFALMSQSGFALPVAPGSVLPVFDQVLVVAGDAQDLLEDLSSFAASMTRTARVLAKATARSLVLLDELGSGTDPDEGGALAVSVLTEDLARGGLTVATTHLSAVKEWANGEPEVLAAAMEFDEAAGRPTFRIRPGAVGRSRALAVAEKAGLPRSVLLAARQRLGSGWAAADAALERLERESRAARAERERAEALATEAEARIARLEAEKERLASEREKLRETARATLDRAVEALRERTRRELEKIREEARAGRAVGKGALTTVLRAAREEGDGFLPDEKASPGDVSPGDAVRVHPFRSVGRVLSVDRSRGQAEVEVSGKRMLVAPADLVRLVAPPPVPPRRAAAAPPAPAAPKTPARGEIVLVGSRVDAALPEVERAINEALLAGKGSLRIVHGYGTGRLAAAIKEFLATHPGVAGHRPGDATEGGAAVTIAELDV